MDSQKKNNCLNKFFDFQTTPKDTNYWNSCCYLYDSSRDHYRINLSEPE